MKNPPIPLEDFVLAHRHLYYSGESVMDDYQYDKIEKALNFLSPNGIVATSVGGESDDPKIKDLANKIKRGMYKFENLAVMLVDCSGSQKPHARSSDPKTSHDAAASVDKLIEKQEWVLRVFEICGKNLTDEELIKSYNNAPAAPVQSESGIRTRRSELVTKGKLVDSGERRKTKSNRNSIVWKLA
jgi:hypothetical protein